MADVTVKQLASTVGVPAERLLAQMHEAGLPHKKETDQVSEEQKQKLLTHLKREHGGEAGGREKITLTRRSHGTLKTGQGKGGRTVQVEVRKKRVLVKRSETETPAPAEPVASQAELEARRIREEEARRAEALRQEEEQRQLEEEKRREEARLREEERLRAEAEAAAREAAASERKKRDVPEPVAEEKPVNPADVQAKTQAEERGGKRVRGKERDRRGRTGPEEESGKGRVEIKLRGGARKHRPRGSGHGLRVDQQGGEFRPTDFIAREVEIPSAITVGELASRMSVKAGEVIKQLMKLGVMATINQAIDQDTATLVVEELGHKPKAVREDAIEEAHKESLDIEGEQVSRPPVVTVMGHVDHGKTSLLDYIRKAKVVSGEAGGITQHIGAYSVETEKGTISFIDTPGHAAFTAMRARGARVTDIVILVVAADDGVMPQTEEAIQHAKAAGVPIIVAINKMDLPGADPERVTSELAARDVVPDNWGGDTQFVPISALTGMGIDALLEAILLQAELLELKAVPQAPARGVVIESRLDRGRGPVVTILVQNGTLRKGDIVIAGEFYGRARAMINDKGEQVDAVPPSMSAELLGLNGTPAAGDDFGVVTDERTARELADFRRDRSNEKRYALQQAARLDNLFANVGEGERRVLKLVLKTDVRGSLEAITQALSELGNDEVQVSVLGAGVGAISESDVNMALTYGAVIFGFNVRADSSAKTLIEREGVDLRYYSVIYELIDDVRGVLTGMLAPEIREEIVGVAEVRDVFKSPKFGQIAGCIVLEGSVLRSKPIRVLRGNVVIFQGELDSLRRFKDDVNEVRSGTECGIGVRNYNDVRVGDTIEVFDTKEVARTL
ncbi:MAG: translation initiation factor IF-2 [Pseudomonadales bacterium]|nr:translation initiation factor IF-2 [Pseudomonadales bacterium]